MRQLFVLFSLALIDLITQQPVIRRISKPSPTYSRADSIPFQLVQNAGLRPVIPVTINDSITVPLMVHSNAGGFVTLVHETAERLNNGPVQKTQNYGFAKDNTISDKGRGTILLPRLRTGANVFTNVSCDVFDLGDNPPYKGMLGLQWLLKSRAVVDFGRQVVFLPDTTDQWAGAMAAVRLARYQVFDLNERPNRRLVIQLSSRKGGRPAAFVVSTVATTSLDSAYFHDEKIPATLTVSGRYMSPKGSLGKTYTADKKLVFYAGMVPLKAVSVDVYDQFNYTKEEREGNFVAGNLGADFMIQNKAIIDFGHKKLYLLK